MTYLPPLVTNADREWALKQCPSWARRGRIFEQAGEIVDDGGWLEQEQIDAGKPDAPNWDGFVIEQIESFERYFGHERKTYREWSGLWRNAWWPKAQPEKRFPMSAPKKFHPFFRKGSPEFKRALAVGTELERKMWGRFNVAQFKPDDPRLAKVQGSGQITAPDLTMRIVGDRE